MGVKTIFKVLIGSTAAITLSVLLIELIGATLTSVRIQQDMTQAVQMACEFYDMESFRDTPQNLPQIKSASGIPLQNPDGTRESGVTNLGSIYAGGYGSTAKYNKLYGSQSALNSANNISAGNLTAFLYNYNQFKNLQMTPKNVGSMYLEPKTLTRAIAYTLAQNLTIGSDQGTSGYYNIQDWLGSGNNMIKLNGFIVDIEKLRVDGITYSKYDLPNQRAQFEAITGEHRDTTVNQTAYVAQINISVPVYYTGVTSMFQHVIEHTQESVNGLDGNGGNTVYSGTYSSSNDSADSRYHCTVYYYNIT